MITRTYENISMLDMKSVLVALSGGADSVTLLYILKQLSDIHCFKVYAAHVNHGLRGDDAKRDADFSRSLCEKLGVEFFLLNADVRAEAKRRKMSEELCGREVRYEFFRKLMDEHNIEFTATAHHKNDNAETILMNFMRGSGISGLCGIPCRRDRFIRPLINISRDEIEQFCAENKLGFVTDKTNSQTDYTRNKIRHILIPRIEQDFNPSFINTVTANASVIADDADFLELEAKKAYDECVCDNYADIPKLLALHTAISKRVIRMMIDNICGIYDVSHSVTDSVMNIVKSGRSGACADIIRTYRARVEYNRLVIESVPNETHAFSYTLSLGVPLYIPELNATVTAEYTDKRLNDGAEYFCADLSSEIVIRSRLSGDKFTPSGMRGSKKVKDFMIDKKVPKSLRDLTGILTIDGEIAWIMGLRRSDSFKFTNKGIKIFVKY